MKSAMGASATGAQAIGTAALGSLALGAMAVGAMAVGALAIGRLAVGRAQLRRVEIGELKVGRLDIGPAGQPGMVIAVVRIRAAPGKEEAMARLLLDQVSSARTDAPGLLVYPPHRSASDPGLFLLYEQYADEAAFERHAHAGSLDALRHRIAAQGLAAGSAEDAVEVELYRTI